MTAARGPVLAVGGVILDGDRVVLVRRAHPPMVGRWTLPGGRVEAGETLADALRREIAEETGLAVEVGELLEVVELQARDVHYVILDYLCTPRSGQLAAGDDAAEATWAPAAEIDRWQVTEAVRGVVTRGLARLADRVS